MRVYQPSEPLDTVVGADAVYYRTPRAVVRMRGADRLDLLHRLSTNAVHDLADGGEATTMLTSEKGRIVELVRVLAREEETLLVLAGEDAERVRAWLDKYTIMDDVATDNLGDTYAVLLLSGDRLRRVVEGAFGVSLPDAGKWNAVDIDGETGMLARDARLTGVAGAMLVIPSVKFESAARQLEDAGARSIESGTYETLRVAAGLPAAGAELSENYNPLEAGLVQYISWTKGCYIGQEVIARLDSYDKVQRHLVGFELATLPEAFSDDVAILEPEEGKRIGTLTSVVQPAPGAPALGLGYVRTAYAVPDLQLRVVPAEGAEPVAATVARLPFAVVGASIDSGR